MSGGACRRGALEVRCTRSDLEVWRHGGTEFLRLVTGVATWRMEVWSSGGRCGDVGDMEAWSSGGS